MEPRLRELEFLRSCGIISQQEYESSRTASLLDAVTAPRAVSSTLSPQAQCRFGHSMQWLHEYTGADGGKRTGDVCDVCCRKIPKHDYFFYCNSGTEEECQAGLVVCHECGLTGNEEMHPTNQRWINTLFGCGDDAGVCFDSFFCYYCLLTRQYSANSYEGLPTDGSDPGFNCRPDSCCQVTSTLLCDIFTLSMFGACMSYSLYQILDRKYSIAVNDQRSGCGNGIAPSCFCRCCVLAQVAQEHSVRGNFMGGVCCSKVPSNYATRHPPARMGEAEVATLIRRQNASSSSYPSTRQAPPPAGVSFPPAYGYHPQPGLQAYSHPNVPRHPPPPQYHPSADTDYPPPPPYHPRQQQGEFHGLFSP